MAVTRAIPEQLARDLNATLARLRTARTVGDTNEERITGRRLDWLLDQIARQQ